MVDGRHTETHSVNWRDTEVKEDLLLLLWWMKCTVLLIHSISFQPCLARDLFIKGNSYNINSNVEGRVLGDLVFEEIPSLNRDPLYQRSVFHGSSTTPERTYPTEIQDGRQTRKGERDEQRSLIPGQTDKS